MLPPQNWSSPVAVEWIRLSEAHSAIVQRINARPIALDLLRDKLVRGEIKAMSGHLEIFVVGQKKTIKDNYFLDAEFWQECIILEIADTAYTTLINGKIKKLDDDID